MKRFLFVLFAILAFVLIVSCDMEIPVVEDKPSETNSSEQGNNGDNQSSEYIIETEIDDGVKTEYYYNPNE